MDQTRRDAVMLGLATMLVGEGTMAAAQGMGHGPPGAIQIFRIHAGADGHSHIERIAAVGQRKPLPVMSAFAASFSAGTEDWHHAPFKTFVINTAGNNEVELSDGTRQAIGPGDLVYLEDLAGKGHLTRLLTDGACLFLRMPDDFDVVAWARA